MFLLKVPSWLEIEQRVTDEMGYQSGAGFRTPLNELVPSLELNLRRIQCVRTAFIHAEWEAAYLLRQRFADLDISSVLNELLGVVTQMAMIVAGSVLTGGAIGAGVGLLGGGAGAIPLGAAGAAMGLQVGSWILSVLGLTALTEFFVEGLPAVGEYYLRGIRIAWNGARCNEGLTPYSQDDPFAAHSASHQIARGHVEAVILLLGAIVSYLTRGRGDAQALAQQMHGSTKGARLAAWMLKHEDALKNRPELQITRPRSGPYSPQKPAPVSPPANAKQSPVGKPNKMALYEVECFKASRLPSAKIGEFNRQLHGQEHGLDQLTVQEFLSNIASPHKRSSSLAKSARNAFENSLNERFLDEFALIMDAVDAKDAAVEKARQTMANLAGLHNPDLTAGGKDIVSDFGDKQVNSSIGPQWKNRIKNLQKAVENTPPSLRSDTLLNVKLQKCK